MDHKGGLEGQAWYRIRVRGHLDSRWSPWFDGLTLITEESGETVLYGPLEDQAALHGLLARIRDLGLPLLAVSRTKADEG